MVSDPELKEEKHFRTHLKTYIYGWLLKMGLAEQCPNEKMGIKVFLDDL